MAAKFQVISLSSRDTEGMDTRDEPKLLYPDALATAKDLKFQGKAFRVHVEGEHTAEQMQSFIDLGAVT